MFQPDCQGTLQPRRIQNQRAVGDTQLAHHPFAKRVRIRHLRHPFRMDEGPNLNAAQAGKFKRLDEAQLLVQREDARFVLKPVAQELILDHNFAQHVAHPIGRMPGQVRQPAGPIGQGDACTP